MPREGHGSRNAYRRGNEHLSGVMPREGHGSRNIMLVKVQRVVALMSCPARGMGVEIGRSCEYCEDEDVMPREGHGSRNWAVM